jgi:hypothetical protein
MATENITPFVECPYCHKLLEVHVTQCPECRELISREYAASSLLVVAFNTAACGSAATIRDRNPFMILVIIGSVIFYVVDVYTFQRLFFFKATLVWSAMAIMSPLQWLRRFGRFPLGDEKFTRAIVEMKRSFTKWVVILVVQMIVLFAT